MNMNFSRKIFLKIYLMFIRLFILHSYKKTDLYLIFIFFCGIKYFRKLQVQVGHPGRMVARDQAA